MLPNVVGHLIARLPGPGYFNFDVGQKKSFMTLTHAGDSRKLSASFGNDKPSLHPRPSRRNRRNNEPSRRLQISSRARPERQRRRVVRHASRVHQRRLLSGAAF
jgi:hypothetical protein